MVDFLKKNSTPEVGYCNYRNYSNRDQIAEKALETTIVGSGKDIALRYYASFIFVGGYIIRRDIFLKYNTSRFDGSVYVQMYFSTRAMIEGYRFFTISEIMVLSGIFIDSRRANSYRDKLVRKWNKFKVIDGGLPDVFWVIISAFQDAGINDKKINYSIIKKHYVQSMTYWLLEYRNCGGFVDSVGLAAGMYPRKHINKYPLSNLQKLKIYIHWLTFSAIGLFTPVFLFNKLRFKIYNYLKKKQKLATA
jgi:hypothetical protein